jgi:ABC-type branched-subunit amino acid transport system permease subunit
MTQARIVFAVAGFLAAVLGVALGDRRLVWVAIVLLGISFVLRLIVRRRTESRSPPGGPV